MDDARGALAHAVDESYAHASALLKKLLFGEERCLAKLQTLKRFFLASQGDFLVNFMDIADAELHAPAERVSYSRLAHLLHVALSPGGGAPAVDAGLKLKPALAARGLKDHLDAIHAHGAADDGRDPTLAAGPLLGVDAFVLDVEVAWPSSIMLSKRAVVKYQLVFRHLFRTKRVEKRLLAVWTSHQATKDVFRGASRARRDLGRVFLLRGRMLHFAQNLVHYTMFEVVEARHAALLADLDAAPTVDDAITRHDAFLDVVLKECLLANHKLLNLLADLCAACDRFADSANRFDESALFFPENVAGLPPAKRAALRGAHLESLAALPAYAAHVAEMDANWRVLVRAFLDALRTECHLQRNSHLVDLYNRLHSHDQRGY